MITASIGHADLSKPLQARLNRAYAFLQTHDFLELREGRYEIDADMFFLVQRYVTHRESEARYEAHRRYVDIQYLLSGQETFYWADVAQMTPLIPFDAQKDIGFYKDAQRYGSVTLTAGELAVFFPEDCHKPSFHPEGEEPCGVEKVVMKVRYGDETSEPMPGSSEA